MDGSSENGTLKRRQRFRRLKVWKYFCDYFPIRLHKSTDLDPQRTYVFGIHTAHFVKLSYFKDIILMESFRWELLGILELKGLTLRRCFPESQILYSR